MITREECNELSKIRPWDRTQRGYVKNLILQSALNGDTECEFDNIFVIQGEIRELKELGYEVEHIQNQQENVYRIKWN